MTRTALVTGAASGIGLATARELEKRGYEVVVTDIDADAAKRAGCDLGLEMALQFDVTDAEAAQEVVDRVLERRGVIDVLINNAGVVCAQPLHATSAADWARTMAVNVTGVFNCCRAVLPAMMERHAGAIVNVASVGGLAGLRDRAAYCASKGAVISLTKSIAVDYVGFGIRSNCVCPGSTDTPWVERLTAASVDPAATHRAIVARQPMGRLGRPEEIASAIAYLASDEAGVMTGSALVIDGGMMAGWV